VTPAAASSVDPSPKDHPTRRSQSANTWRYDRIARFYSTLLGFFYVSAVAKTPFVVSNEAAGNGE
jgi:hypothetical protein